MSQAPTRFNPDMPQDLDAFDLNGGLDLISPKIQAQKGTMLDCLNREIVDRAGYGKIAGLDRYDGRTTPAQEDVFMIYNTSYGSGVTTDFAAGDCLVITGTTNIFGVVVGSTYTASGTVARIYYARVNKDFEPTTSQTVAVITEAQTFAVTGGIYPLSGADPVTLATPTPDSIVDSLNTYAAALRTRITALHDTPVGLHWYRDQLYAVVTDRKLYFDSGGTTVIQPNWYVKGATSSAIGRVLNVELITSQQADPAAAWAAGTAAGLIQYELISGTAFQNNEALSYDDNPTLTSPTLDVATVCLVTDLTGPPDAEFASLWRSRSEQQSVDDGDGISGAGWSRIDHGWEFDFTGGFSETGSFTRVERGSTTNFTYTTSSEVEFPITIYNGSNVSGTSYAPQSINPSTSTRVDNGDSGWKTNASATVFAGSDALDTALVADDSNYAYANLWYWGAGTRGSFGFAAGTLSAFDRNIYGPVNTFNSRSAPSVGTEVFDADFFTTQARAPLILKDFSGATAAIPEGSLITGVGIVVKYDSQHYAEGYFATTRNANFKQNTLDWIDDQFSWTAQFCNTLTANTAGAIGTANTALIAIQETAASYEYSENIASPTDSFFMADTITGQTATIGGSGVDFGIDNFSRNTLLDETLAIALFAQVTGAPVYPSIGMQNYSSGGSSTIAESVLGLVRLKVDQIIVTFYYTEPSARYYVGDGAGNVCSVDLVYTVQEDGSFTSSTASGSLQVTNLQADVAGAKRRVESGDTLHLTEAAATAGTGSIATVASDMAYNGLPSLDRVVDTSSRYQFITANFFGRDDWDGFYGVSGADRAFSFATFDADGSAGDEDYIIRIATNVNDLAGDKPRHIAFHHYHLALGYNAGIVRMSVPGEPENFDGAAGATETGVGDKVTGLLSMKGMTLGVFCENSIWGIAGTDADNFTTQVLAPYTGALEYTVVDMGIPVYCDSRGVSTLEQSAAYGNFVGSRLSKPVTPWIIPRMVRNSDLFSVANGSGVVCAIPVRAKNQYRVFFKDGYVLVMTINPDSGPVFTYSRYYIGQSAVTETSKFVVPFAWSSQVDDKGVERIHFSHYSPLSDISAANGKYAYELDEGWSFAGNFIPAEYVLNWYFKNPFQDATIKKVRIDGLTKGVGSCKVYTAKEYDETFSTLGIDASLTRDSYSTDFKPATKMCNATVRGRNVTIKVKDEFRTEDAITDPYPGDVHQIMLVQTDAGGKPDS